jgi:ABC-2 type transport system permease protein
MNLRRAVAFLRKDLVNEASYKFSFVLQFAGVFLSATAFFFLSKLFGSAFVPELERYGGNYFAFVLIGIAFSDYLGVSLHSFARNIRSAQTTGTLEALLSTRTPFFETLLYMSFYGFLLTTLRVFVYLVIGALVFGVDLGGANVLSALVVLVLTVVSFSAIGLFSAAFIVVFKRGDPVSWVFASLSWVLAGVYYPVSVLPAWMQKISYAIPVTHALEGMRLSLLRGASLGSILPQIGALLVLSAVLLPISILALNRAVRTAKLKGTLIHY